MALVFEAFTSAGTATSNGVFIPVAALPGIVSTNSQSELNSPGITESKVVLALLTQIYNKVRSLSSSLGFSVSKGNPTGVGTDIVNQNYGASYTHAINLNTGVVETIPLPTTGTNVGKGGVSLFYVFPGALKVNSGDAIDSAGIIIPSAEIEALGGGNHASLTVADGADNRKWFNGFFGALVNTVSKKSATVSSAIIAASRGTTNIFNPPAAFTDPSNPTSGIPANNLRNYVFITTAFSVTIQLLLNQETQSFDVNVESTT